MSDGEGSGGAERVGKQTEADRSEPARPRDGGDNHRRNLDERDRGSLRQRGGRHAVTQAPLAAVVLPRGRRMVVGMMIRGMIVR